MDDNPIHERCKCTSQSFAPYHGQRRHSDVTILCKDGVRIPAHKVILCLASPFFEKALDPDKGFQESHQNEINLLDHAPKNIAALIDFIYLHRYAAPTPPDAGIRDQLLAHASMHATADYFMVACLRDAAHAAFAAVVKRWPHGGGCGGFDAADVAAVIEAVYTSTPAAQRGLRDVVLDFAAQHYGELISPSTTSSSSPPSPSSSTTSFTDTMDTIGEFSRDLATLFFERSKALASSFGGRQFLCTYCVERYSIPVDGFEGLQCKFCRRGGKVVAIRD
ncbi:BTB/POZ domain-containing protein [Phyllosticta capitalensis]|uniref:BTB/POZ domain-containing protein n=1 Tax=Phyllosticta capitalensis TaxID=121624 RepID=UPI00312D3DCB